MTKEERLAAEKLRIRAMHDEELGIAQHASYIFGIDEAGRGPLCGPVVAGCCVLADDTEILYLNDSKKLSEKKREQLYAEITDKALAYGIGMASPERIDTINILNATYEAMQEAFEKCMSMLKERIIITGSNNINAAEAETDKMSADSSVMNKAAASGSLNIDNAIVLVDGNRTVPGISLKQTAVVKGDAKCPSISAASILAKVTRDRLMEEYAMLHPEYGFEKHKGYGTKEHIAAIRKYGITDIYRKSFLKNIL